ncbi:MAG: exodeoxyribonuclease III [Alphaproteobacteria bacterium]|nr:exodeoxyribonuclease III [Alphaproteobacteria bacterium]
MKIISYNLNGIRAAMKKGLVEWMQQSQADIFCFQELKANIADVDLTQFNNLGYQYHWFSAQKKGYSGVAIFSKNIVWDEVILGNGFTQSDYEGRVIIGKHPKFSLINAYFPSGTSGEERQTYKMQWLQEFHGFIKNIQNQGRPVIITGDYNIAHTEIDIHDPKGNKNTSGFLPEERQWITEFLEQLNLIDSFRYMNPDFKGGYTWWSQRFPSVREQNKGWRIDYMCLSKSLENHLKSAFILPQVKHSDHCPLGIELDF